MNTTNFLQKVSSTLLRATYMTRGQIKRFSSTVPEFEYINVFKPADFVYHVELNRPNKSNALNQSLWREIGECFRFLGGHEECRSIILSGNGKHFCGGIDLADFMQNIASAIAAIKDVGRKAAFIDKFVKQVQDDFTAIETCNKPVIAAVHNGCVGAGLDMITACDMRHCSVDAWFQLKEVDIGIAADVGVLQRLPKIIHNDSFVREIAYTARKVSSEEALSHGLVSRTHSDKESMMKHVTELAALIASKSPIAVQGSKKSLVYSRDNTVQQGLDQVRTWNMSMLQSEDVVKSAQASISKTTAEFDNL